MNLFYILRIDLNVLQVANLSWIERKLASTLFAEPPSATYSEAVEHFLKAEDLSSMPCKENRLFLAKCNISQGYYDVAVLWLDLASEVPITMPYVSQDVIYMIKQGRLESLKVCDNG